MTKGIANSKARYQKDLCSYFGFEITDLYAPKDRKFTKKVLKENKNIKQVTLLTINTCSENLIRRIYLQEKRNQTCKA